MAKTDSRRRKVTAGMLRKTGVIRSRLKWSESDHQAALELVGVRLQPGASRRTARDMTFAQFEAYVRHAYECGFDEPSKHRVPHVDSPSNAQIYRLKQLGDEVIRMRADGDTSFDRLNREERFVRGIINKAVGGKVRTFWSRKDMTKAIDSLTAMLRRLEG